MNNRIRGAVLGSTWIDPEELAYNSYSGAPTRSNRRGRVRFPDGKLRIVRLGVADTFFSIPAKPAHGRVGFVSVSSLFSQTSGSEGEQEFTFTPPRIPPAEEVAP